MGRSIAALSISLLTTFAFAGDLTVDQIVEKSNHVSYYAGNDGRARVEMVITDEQGRTRNRRFTILRWDEPAADGSQVDGDQDFYVYFDQPADVSKMVFMVHKHLGADDDRWLYMPSLDLVKRIAASDKRTSFVGSDFFYEDVSGRRLEDDTHELVETTDNYYVVKNTPTDPSLVEFASYTMWIHKDTFLPIKVEYVNREGEKYREYAAEGVEQIQGHWTVTKSSMKNLDTGSTTVMSYSDVKYDIGLDGDIFTERYLRKPPRNFLR
ncbi:MAG: outer membrane lipoprotein-sorting protein [Phycisphaeraceae bacterium]|nr:MAG: outer membrane lipoprotein-sorting protein [Phycisphaeraceae bacterium]